MTANLLPLLDRFTDVPVMVLGDLMLDRYLWGSVARISPEAPVPVLRIAREDARLGGAGSVIANLSALDAQVHAFTAVGDDAAGQQMAAMLAALPGVNAEGVLHDPALHTTEKTRVIARNQHLLRIDRDAEDLPPQVQQRLLERALAGLEAVKAVLIPDYGKGVATEALCKPLFAEARRRGLPVLVDPHPTSPFERFAGATCLTPNRSETARALGFRPEDPESIRRAARTLIERFELDWVVVTLDKDGMFLMHRDPSDAGRRFPAKARNVYDVAGAGDMVLTVLGLAVAAGLELPDALRMANVAAGWEVEQVGVLPLPRAELAAELSSTTPPQLRRKIVPREDALPRVREARDAGKEIVFTNGCFDLLHAGHVHFIQGCRAKGDFLIVGLNTDESVAGLSKGPNRPVLPLEERSTVLAGLEAVDLVVPFAESTPIALIELLRPDVLCKGEDYIDKIVVGRELVEGYGGRVELVELLPGVSTTNIIARITES